jgi:beta-galactosidase
MEITDQLFPGEVNSVAVRVNADQPEGWWYEGAGIYRNVFLHVGETIRFVPEETVIKADVCGAVSVSARLDSISGTEETLPVSVVIHSPTGDTASESTFSVTVPAYGSADIAASLSVSEPLFWHVDHPHLYTVTVRAGEEEMVERFGFRSFHFDTDKGFFLNGSPLKLRGACVHQDFGGVGVALSDNLQAYKIARLKEMGVNAYRTAHHAPAPALLRACDELGMLVMDETRMFGTSPEALRQLTDLIKRDRNHASVFIWSIGNEEFSIQNTDFGRRLAVHACRAVRALDDTRTITYGGNNSDHFEGINGGVPVRGVNYLHNGKIDGYHKAHPDQPIVGTEESSYVLSRGGTKNDLGSGILDSTGQVTMDWGSTPKGWVKYTEERPWYSGGFMWTGFDYRGEPSPFSFSNVSSSFGTIDLCGMEKPPFYYYKAWWTDDPVLKLLPAWNAREGDTVTVSTFTNCESVTLILNGRVLGTKTVDRFDAPLWEIPFEAGTLTAEGVKNGTIYRDTLCTAGATAAVTVTPILTAEAEGDIEIYELGGIDRCGIPCRTASELVSVSVKDGTIVGVGNGDPASYDYEVKPMKHTYFDLPLFRFDHGFYPVPAKAPNASLHSAWRSPTHPIMIREEKSDLNPILEDDFRIVALSRNSMTEPETLTFETELTIGTRFDYVEFERLHGEAVVLLDGKEIGNNLRGHLKNARPYRFYADLSAGHHTLTVKVSLSDRTRGGISGYCRLGKTADEPWTVRLHYGKARVFVKRSAQRIAPTVTAALQHE